jgi:histidinol-phosphate aminotransferase
MPRIQASILQAGFTPLPSVANFFLIRFASPEAAAKAHQFMSDRDILLRRMTPYGLPDCLRMSIGNDAEMELVSAAFKDLSHIEGMGIAPEINSK